jgi:hypothetical protein
MAQVGQRSARDMRARAVVAGTLADATESRADMEWVMALPWNKGRRDAGMGRVPLHPIVQRALRRGRTARLARPG